MSFNREQILDWIQNIGLDQGADAHRRGWLREIDLRDDGVFVYLEVPAGDADLPRRVTEQLRQQLGAKANARVEVLVRIARAEEACGCGDDCGCESDHDDDCGCGSDHDHGHAHSHAQPTDDPNEMPKLLGQVKHVIAVASGKGGVGKSAIAANLAISLAREGYRTGLLDADIYGPSMPLLMGSRQRPQVQNGKLMPLETKGVLSMSLGYLIEPDSAMIWRGPMVMSALTQLMQDVVWPELDFLVVDMPPGTGDAQLTMAQRVQMAGAIVVSTPQEMALEDARKAINMFRKVNVPVLGLVENMSWFRCDNCDKRHYLFGENGVKREAEVQQLELLAQLPLLPVIRESGDQGDPVVLHNEEVAEIFRGMVDKLLAKVEA